ncbi:MAG TPA: TonB family protein [Bryobacteraceae bacterium]|jgi:TonB family protein|nr:TonB family protein [Bryobacteraceae bacterium]
MTLHRDTTDLPEKLTPPLLGSLVLHAGIAALIVGYGYWRGRNYVNWGDPNSLGGGAAAITAVKSIPMITQGRINPVANDTESQVPAPPPKTEPKREPVPEPEAIPLPGRAPKPGKSRPSDRRYDRPRNPNQVYSREGQSASSAMFSPSPGGGGVGSGSSSPFGTQLGWYEQLLRERVSRNWRSQDLDARLRTLPAAVVSFELLRDGSIRNLKIQQSSGNFTIDQSAQRAIVASAPFPPLPPQYQGNSATLEFWFRLQQ